MNKRKAVRDYLAQHPVEADFIAHLARIVGASWQGHDGIGFPLMEEDAWCSLIVSSDEQVVEALLRCVSGHEPQQLGYYAQDLGKFCDVTSVSVPDRVIKRLSPRLAREYGIFPVSFEDGVLTVARAKPENGGSLDKLRILLSCEVKVVLGEENAIWGMIDKHYGEET